MSTGYLKVLTVENLRGSTRQFSLLFEKGKKLTIVYGENGTGKSTICDALDLLGNGRVGSLDNRGLGQTQKYWPSIGKSSTDVQVKLEGSTGECTARLSNREAVIQPAEGRPQIEVLRRSQILSLVEAKPGERYEAIRRFIDVSEIEASEKVLRELIRRIKGDRQLAVERVQENQNTIEQFWDSAGRPSHSAFDWARAAIARDATLLISEREAIERLHSAYFGLSDFPSRYRTATAQLESAKGSVQRTQGQYEEALTTVASGAEDLMDILRSAQSYVTRHPDLQQCPLCGSSEYAQGLAERIKGRIESFKELTTAKAGKSSADAQLDQAKSKLTQVEEDYARKRTQFLKALSSFDWPQDINLADESCPEQVDAASTWLEASAHLRASWYKAQATRQDEEKFIVTLKRALKTYDDNVEAQKGLDVLVPRLEQALAIVEDERRQFTDGVLSEIAKEVGRLYEAIHPRERLDKISLQLDENKRASLELAAEYQGRRDTPPQAYFSDSHLDTLGLCVFLALAEKGQPENTILVLDDVLASADEPHVDRIIDVLYEQAQRFRHCLITTHYGPWKHKLRWGWLKHNQCQFVELSKWTSTEGLLLINSVPDIQRLAQLLGESPPDPQLVCAKSGVLLEAALDFITSLYECSVPRRGNGLYTLGDLLPSVDKKLRKALKVEVLTGSDASGQQIYRTVELGPILDELHRIAQARNVF
ncbi:MAG: AAA family ATPase, partial [Pseudomonadota bacterium]|nr:AAA family ATPase [Pseudomonadota bacterium]